MFVRGLLATAAAVCLFGTQVVAQGVPRPAELPPASYKGQQYVDSRGCVFLRAGIGNQVNWVARLSRDRTPLCGQAPSGRPVEVAAAPAPAQAAPIAPASRPAVSPGPRATGRPMDTIASLRTPPTIRSPQARTTVDARSYVPAAPRPTASAPTPAPAVAAPAAVRATPGCPAGSPHGKRARLVDGRTTLFCSANPDFDLAAAVARANAARAPAPAQAAPARAAVAAVAAPPPAPVGRAASGYTCPPSAPVARRYALTTGGSTVMCSDAGGSLASLSPPLALGEATFRTAEAPVPKGYKKAWKDDRLNPRRGQGTAQGQAAQDRVWTRETPARLVAETKRKAAPAPKSRVVASTSNAPQAQATGKSYTVQVGSFGVPANAKATANRLAGMGLPVTLSRGAKLQTVRLGPFASADAARQALSQARRAGFGDAFIR